MAVDVNDRTLLLVEGIKREMLREVKTHNLPHNTRAEGLRQRLQKRLIEQERKGNWTR